MGYVFMLEQVSIDIDLALGKITEEEACKRMAALNERAQRYVAVMQVIAFILPCLILVGLALLAVRLGTFG